MASVYASKRYEYHPLFGKNVLVYLDNIILIATVIEKHLMLPREVFMLLCNFYIMVSCNDTIIKYLEMSIRKKE